MSFLNGTEDSARRGHEGASVARVLIDQFRTRISLIFAWTVLQLRKFVRPVTDSRRPLPLIHGGEKHFTILGTQQQPAIAPRRPITELFPIANSNDRSPKTPRHH
jgi:hypothetical protein